MRYSETSESLRENKDFQIVYRYGRSAANRTLVIYAYPRAGEMRKLQAKIDAAKTDEDPEDPADSGKKGREEAAGEGNSAGTGKSDGTGKAAGKLRMPHSWKVTGYEKNRVGISVSKKVGNSIVRHHLCRLIRESYRKNEDRFVGGLDLVVIARPGARELPFSDIERALLSVSRRLGVLR